MRKIVWIYILLSSLKVSGQKDVTSQWQPEIMQAYQSCLLQLVVIHSNQLYPLDSMIHHGAEGAFPVYENGRPKYVYWHLNPLPQVYATIYYDEKTGKESAKYDETKRELTPLEAFAFRMTLSVINDINADPSFKTIPNAYLTLIPLIGPDSYHVFASWKAEDQGMVIFGNDYEYTFDINSIMLSKKQNHASISYLCVDSIDQPSAPMNRIGFHSHENEKTRGIITTCLQSVYTFSSLMKWKTFYFTDLTHVFAFDLQTSKVTRYTHREFEKQNTFTFKSIIK
jgi:hypothetical protein